MRRLRAAFVLSPLADGQPTRNPVYGSFTPLNGHNQVSLQNSTALDARASDGEVECAAEGSGMVSAVEEAATTDIGTRLGADGAFISPDPSFRLCGRPS
jgi:hypothetical protein